MTGETLSGRVALVTGAASGIGRSLVGALLAAGDRVAAADLDAAALDSAAAADAWPRERLELLRLDVRDPGAWSGAIDRVVARWSRLDVLLNVAGVLRPGRFLDATTGDADLQIDVNLKGVVHGTRAAAGVMERQRAGHIVNIASLAALSPIPGLALYTASKFGVRGFSLAAAHELRPLGIAVTVVCPDAVRTPMLDLQASCPEAALTFSGTPLEPAELTSAILGPVLARRPLEVSLPGSRGLLAKLAGALPRLGLAVAPFLRRRGARRQARYRPKA